MEVEFVEEVGLTAAAPQSIAIPPPPSQAPEIGEAEPVEPAPVGPARRRRRASGPLRPSRMPRPPAKPAPRVSRIGDDFLKGIARQRRRRSSAPPKPAAPTFSATARASVGQAILRQVQPCADRQPYHRRGRQPGPADGQPQAGPQRPPDPAADRPRHVGRSRRYAPNMATCWKTRSAASSPNARRCAFRPSCTTRPTAAGTTITFTYRVN